MRVAEICSSCSTYINASCIIYNGDYLSNIELPPLTSLDEALLLINNKFAALSGEGVPTSIPSFFGQKYIDTLNLNLYLGLSTSSSYWGLVGPISTTTTTTTSS